MALNAEPSTRRWLPSHVYANLDAAATAIGYLISCYSNPGDPRLGPYVLAVERRDAGTLLGHVGFSPLGAEVEVSYAVAESARGHGHGAEALIHACNWIANVFAVRSVVAVTASENTASRRTLERARFTHARDEVMVFQGSTCAVSRYRWSASSIDTGGISRMGPNALDSIVRYVPVGAMLATAGQPTEEQLAAIAAAGFDVVINLALHDDPRYSLKDQAATLALLGVEYIHIPVQFSSPTLSDLQTFFDAMERSAGRKVFVHCAHNKRVPVFLALYRVARQGWSRADAFASMREVWQPDETWEHFIVEALERTTG